MYRRIFGAGAVAPPRIYIDLTDVIEHAIWHPTGAGIQRVQIEIATTLVRSDPGAIPFSLYDDIWRNLRAPIKEADGASDRLYPRLRQYRPCPGARSSVARPLHTAKLLTSRLGTVFDSFGSRPPRLTSRDTLFVGGQFWMSQPIIDFYKGAVADGAKLVILLHDLIPITDPKFTGHDFVDAYRQILRLPAHFVVTTAFTARELERARRGMGEEPATVSVVPLAEEFPGAQRNEHALLLPREVARLAGRSFALCVGTVEVRKNHETLLSVWDELEAELGDRLPTLVVAGRRGWKADAALRKLDQLGADSRIAFIEAPSDAALRWLYSSCLFTIYPSFFEGWGLPVGESLWFGKACAASNRSSIPHVGRDLCLYFSPDDKQEMKAAVLCLLDPEIRRSYEAKIQAASLRTWGEVARDIERIITQPRAMQTARPKAGAL